MRNKSAYIWGLLNRFLPSVISLVSTMVMSRFLTPEDFGTIGVVSIIFFVARTLIDSGLGGSLINAKHVNNLDYSTISSFNIFMGCILFTLICLFSGHIENFFNIKDLKFVVILLGLTLVINPIGLVPGTILQKELKFSLICKINIISIIISTIISIVLAILHFGVYALVLNQVLQSIIIVILNFFYTKYRFSLRFSFLSLRRLFSFGAFTALTSVVDSIYENLLTTFTGKYLSIQQAGYLSQAKRLEEALTVSLSGAISSVSFPILSQIKDDSITFRRECESIYKTILLISIPILMLVIAFSEELILLLFGKSWISASFYLNTLMCAGVFVLMETLLRVFIKSMGVANRLFYYTIVKRLLGIILIFIFLTISKDWMIYGYIVSAILAFIINSYLYCKLTFTNFFVFLFRSFIYIFPSLLLLFFYFLLDYFFSLNFSSRLLIVSFLVLIYIFLMLPIYGVNIKNKLLKK